MNCGEGGMNGIGQAYIVLGEDEMSWVGRENNNRFNYQRTQQNY
jgi:hypothetical protein